MYRWHVDLHNVAQLRSTCNYVHILSMCLFRTKNEETNNSLEEICDSFATGTLLYSYLYSLHDTVLYNVPINF